MAFEPPKSHFAHPVRAAEESSQSPNSRVAAGSLRVQCPDHRRQRNQQIDLGWSETRLDQGLEDLYVDRVDRQVRTPDDTPCAHPPLVEADRGESCKAAFG